MHALPVARRTATVKRRAKFWPHCVQALVTLNHPATPRTQAKNDSASRPTATASAFRCVPLRTVFAIIFAHNSPVFNVTLAYDERAETVFSERPRTRAKRPWLSLAAENMRPGFAVPIDYVRVDGPRPLPAFPKAGRHGDVSQTLPRLNASLGIAAVTAGDVLESLGELVEFAEPLAASVHVARCVSDGIVAFTERWQRRSLRIVRNTSRMAAHLARELNATAAKIDALKDGVAAAFKALRAEVHDFESRLYFGVIDGYSLGQGIQSAGRTVTRSPAIRLFVAISVVEAVAALGVVAFQMLPCASRDAHRL